MNLAGVVVAVTGASGFCGGAVARGAAAAGAAVVCLGRRPGPVGAHRPWDATRGRPDLSGVDVVLHLAGAVGDPAPRQDAWYRAVNVDGTARLLEAAAARPVVWMSSSSVYDPRPDRSRVTEDHPIGGHLSGYGATKAAGEALALAAGAVVLRPRAVYGPGDRQLLPRLRALVRQGSRGAVLPLPGPDVWQSFTAVENLADACLAAVGWPSGAYNVADARPYRRDAALRRVLTAMLRRPVRVVHLPAGAARTAARVVRVVTRPLPVTPRLTRYGVDVLSATCVLDLARATAQGWRPRRSLDDFVAALLRDKREAHPR